MRKKRERRYENIDRSMLGKKKCKEKYKIVTERDKNMEKENWRRGSLNDGERENKIKTEK